MGEARKLLLAGQWRDGERTADIRSPWDGRVVSTVAQASKPHADEALAFAHAARPRLQAQPTHARRAVLERIVASLRARAEELAQLITAESAKPISAARFEEIGRAHV